MTPEDIAALRKIIADTPSCQLYVTNRRGGRQTPRADVFMDDAGDGRFVAAEAGIPWTWSGRIVAAITIPAAELAPDHLTSAEANAWVRRALLPSRGGEE